MTKDRSVWEFGDRGERLVFRALLADRWHLLNAAEAAAVDTAPLLAGADADLILPDILGFRDGAAAWFEVKSKTDAIEFRKVGEWRHGFDKPNYEQYQEISTVTDVPVYIIIYEKRRQKLLQGKLRDLPVVDETTDEQASRDYDEHVVFFPRDSFDVCADATIFDGDVYIDGKPLTEHSPPVFDSRGKITAWSRGVADD
jgi:hypothetical protein